MAKAKAAGSKKVMPSMKETGGKTKTASKKFGSKVPGLSVTPKKGK